MSIMNVHPELLKAPVGIADSRRILATAARQIRRSGNPPSTPVRFSLGVRVKLRGDYLFASYP
jgi:hypothetical protein